MDGLREPDQERCISGCVLRRVAKVVVLSMHDSLVGCACLLWTSDERWSTFLSLEAQYRRKKPTEDEVSSEVSRSFGHAPMVHRFEKREVSGLSGPSLHWVVCMACPFQPFSARHEPGTGHQWSERRPGSAEYQDLK